MIAIAESSHIGMNDLDDKLAVEVTPGMRRARKVDIWTTIVKGDDQRDNMEQNGRLTTDEITT